MTTTAELSSPTPRTTARPVPRWAAVAAHVAALTPVLSFLWRLPLMFGVPMGMDDAFMDDMMSYPLWVRAAYLVGLGVLAEGLAFLALGLVRPWGEIVPRWVPALRGKVIPAWPVVTIATFGGLFATLMFTVAGPFAWPGNFTHVDAWVVLQTLCYVPLVAWGPLVLAVTWAYWRRRRS